MVSVKETKSLAMRSQYYTQWSVIEYAGKHDLNAPLSTGCPSGTMRAQKEEEGRVFEGWEPDARTGKPWPGAVLAPWGSVAPQEWANWAGRGRLWSLWRRWGCIAMDCKLALLWGLAQLHLMTDSRAEGQFWHWLSFEQNVEPFHQNPEKSISRVQSLHRICWYCFPLPELQ